MRSVIVKIVRIEGRGHILDPLFQHYTNRPIVQCLFLRQQVDRFYRHPSCIKSSPWLAKENYLP